MPALVKVGVNRLIEPIKSFGQAYRAIPDDDEPECVHNAEGQAPLRILTRRVPMSMPDASCRQIWRG
jgi:hypothetical protein